jgi:erythrocyte band 7 integral membrane protein
MRQAADSLNSKSAMQIRYLETLKLLGQSGGSKMIFLPEMKDKGRIQHMITQGMIN